MRLCLLQLLLVSARFSGGATETVGAKITDLKNFWPTPL